MTKNHETGNDPSVGAEHDNPFLADGVELNFSLHEAAVEQFQATPDLHRELTADELKLQAGVARRMAWELESRMMARQRAGQPVPEEFFRQQREWTGRAESYANQYTRLVHPPLTFKKLFARIFSRQ
jgi:hypothetical protein